MWKIFGITLALVASLNSSLIAFPRVIDLHNHNDATQIAPSTLATSRHPQLASKIQGLAGAVQFCGDTLPLQQPDVLQRWQMILRSHTRRPDMLRAVRERAIACFPIVDPILKEHGIPADFRYLMVAESELRPRAVSSAGATGYWQFMRATARQLGLRVGGADDQRCDIEKSTVAACRHLNALHETFDSWTLAAAAYNAGAGHVGSRVRTQHKDSYYQLRLHNETELYLYRILFFKEMFTRPEAYGLVIPDKAMNALTEPMPGWPSLLASITEPMPSFRRAYPPTAMDALLADLSMAQATNEQQAGVCTLLMILLMLGLITYIRELTWMASHWLFDFGRAGVAQTGRLAGRIAAAHDQVAHLRLVITQG